MAGKTLLGVLKKGHHMCFYLKRKKEKSSLSYSITLVIPLFTSPVRMYRKSYCTTPDVGIGGGGKDKMLKFYVKVFM